LSSGIKAAAREPAGKEEDAVTARLLVKKGGKMKKAVSFLLSILLASAFSFSQEQYGNLRGIVVDKEGGPLPGVTVRLESELFAPRSVVTSEGGLFRLINVSPGVYSLKCELRNFKTYLQKNLDIRVGTNFDLRIVLDMATIEEEVTVKAESPVVDTKKTSVGANVTQVMLQDVPSARDPWVILQQTPGIQVDRENVGGSLSGMQSSFVSKGTTYQAAMWNMDGITITDQAAFGSPIYYDFDSFDEMQIVTGGQDASVQTAGVSLNLITRRGGNRFQGMARIFFTNKDLQGDNRTEELKKLNYVGDRINQIMDYGFQFGGPILKDRLWFWLGFGVQDTRQLVIAGYPLKYQLYNFNAKLNARLNPQNRAELALYVPLKYAYGRYASATRPPETSLDQRPKNTFYIKLEDEHIFSPNLLLSLKASYLHSGFEITPEGGLDKQAGQDLITGMWSGTATYSLSERPNFNLKLDGDYFREKFLGGSHEFKFGLEYRYNSAVEYSYDPGDVWKLYRNGKPYMAYVEREQRAAGVEDRYSVYLTDGYTRGRLTLNLGLRLDREKSWGKESTVKASRLAPDFLPGLTFPAIDPGIAWVTLSPRIGITFDLTGDAKTMLRANLARYGSQMSTVFPLLVCPAQAAYALYFWRDLNGDNLVTTNELTGYPLKGILDFGGFDPWNPAMLETRNAIDKNIKAPLTDELLLGIEREMFPDFALGATLILRRNHRFTWDPYYDKATDTKITQADYVGPITGSLTFEGKTYAYEYWTLSQYRPVGQIKENRPDYHENYSSLEVTALKRLSHRWMVNASFTYQVHNVHYGEKGYADPTNIKMLDGARFNYPGSDWMAKLSFLYQLPWGFSFSGFANARQGYIFAESVRVTTPERSKVGLGAYVDIWLDKPGEKRYADFYNVDLSLSKTVFSNRSGSLVVQADGFNVFNFHHELQRYNIVNSTRYRSIEKILNPRVIRFGLRYQF
jgi:Carboxypeptidase regulatory-like domain